MLKSIPLLRNVPSTSMVWVRKSSGGECSGGGGKKGLVLGVYQGCGHDDYRPTSAFMRFDQKVQGALMNLLKGTELRRGDVQVYSNVGSDYSAIAVANLGKEGVGINELERLDECKENVRWVAALGTRALQDAGMSTIFVEGFSSAEAAAEGSILAAWRFQEFKNPESRKGESRMELYDSDDNEGWQRGKLKADAQNLARRLEETPSNLMTPTMFAQAAVDALCPCGIQVEVHDKDWVESKLMSAFLTMAKGSCEPPVFLEIGYCGGHPGDLPVVLTGKGITFDSGGLCLKDCKGMSDYRGDLAGGAVVVAAMKCIAQMALPINVTGLIPVCENAIGGLSTRPGDVVRARNGKSIRIDDTDNEGRIILSDALSYARVHKPCMVINIATLTPGMRKTLGTAASGLYTNSATVWREMERAGIETGDRLWRMPLYRYYSERVTDYIGVDVNNVGCAKGGGPCLAAAFLRQFIHDVDFALLDITGTGMLSNGVGHPYYRKGVMTGRPTRTIVQFLYQLACPHSKGDDC